MSPVVTFMSCLYIITIFFTSVVVLYATNGQECPFTVEVHTPKENYVSRNVSLYCNYTADDAELITWFINTSQTVYFASLNDDISEAYASYIGVVDGSLLQNGTYELKLIDAPIVYDKSFWRCVIFAPSCYDGKSSNNLQLDLKGR